MRNAGPAVRIEAKKVRARMIIRELRVSATTLSVSAGRSIARGQIASVFIYSRLWVGGCGWRRNNAELYEHAQPVSICMMQHDLLGFDPVHH